MNTGTTDMLEAARIIRQLWDSNPAVQPDRSRLNGHATIVENLIEARQTSWLAFWTTLGPILDADPTLRAAVFPATEPKAASKASSWFWENEFDRIPKPKVLSDEYGVPIFDNALTVLVGPPGVGKTFLALAVGLAVAQKDYVAYIAAEKPELIPDRRRAWYKYWKSPSRNNLRLYTNAISFLIPDAVTQLISELEVDGRKPRLIILDTVARVLPDEENSSRVMYQFVDSCERIRKAFQCAILCLHHPVKDTKNGSRGPRGHGSLAGAVYATYSLVEEKGTIVLHNDKQNATARVNRVSFQLQQVDLEPDSDTGKSISTCVIVPVGKSAESTPKVTLTEPQRAIHQVLAEAKEALRNADIAKQTDLNAGRVSENMKTLLQKEWVTQTDKHRYLISGQGKDLVS